MEASADRLVLPVDCVTAPSIEAGTLTKTVDRTDVYRSEAIGDIGPVTVDLFASHLANAATVLWNGPMGVFEGRWIRRGYVRGRPGRCRGGGPWRDGDRGGRRFRRRREVCGGRGAHDSHLDGRGRGTCPPGGKQPAGSRCSFRPAPG